MIKGQFILKTLIILIFLIAKINANHFFQNTNEFNDSTLFYSLNKNCNVFINNHSINLDFFKISNDSLVNGTNYKLVFFNANKTEKFDFIKPKDVFFIGHKENQLFSEITLKNIYDFIDIRYYFENGKFRFDFIINPGGNPDDISFNFENSSDIKNYRNILSDSILNLKDLVTYQCTKENVIWSEFTLNQEIIRFNIGKYDPSQKLIIDPLIYSTYIGGLDIDSGEDVKIDLQGNVVIIGETASLNFPTTLGTYQRELNRGASTKSDIFVTKLDANYTHIFTTYIGSSADDFGRGIELDKVGNIYITGYCSYSNNFPIFGNPYSSSHSGAYDAFLIKLDKSGRNVIFSTLLGGPGDDYSLVCKILPDSSIVLAGYTSFLKDTTEFPLTADVFNEIYSGNIDGFVTRFNKDASDILFSGLLGGLKDDFIQDLVIAKDSTILVTGLTRSANFPTTEFALFRDYEDSETNPSSSDAFITRISLDGNKILGSTLFGGSLSDIGYAIGLDNNSNILIAGETRSSDMYVDQKSLYGSLNGGLAQSSNSDGFFAKFNFSLDTLFYSSFLGGERTDRIFDLAVDSYNDIYFVGTTNSQNFPLTSNAYTKKLNDSIYLDITITKISGSGDSLIYSSFISGEKSDLGKAMDLRYTDRMVITGNTSSTFFETTIDAIQESYQDSSSADAYFFEFFIEDYANADYIICSGSSVTLDSEISASVTSLTFSWNPKAGLDNPNVEFPIASPTRSTIYTCLAKDSLGEVYVSQKILSVISKLNTNVFGEEIVDNGKDYFYSSKFNENSFYKWEIEGATLISGQGTNTIKVNWFDAENGKIKVVERGDFGCKDSSELSSFSIKPSNKYKILAFGSYYICEGDTILLDAGSTYSNIIWQDGSLGRYDTVSSSGNYYFTAIDQNGKSYVSPNALIQYRELPPKPNMIFNRDRNELICISAANLYRWYYNGEIIPNHSSRFLTPIGTGCYEVSIETLDSCVNKSDILCITLSNNDYQTNDFINIYPNPSDGLINIETKSNIPNLNYKIMDITGNILLNGFLKNSKKANLIDLKSLKSGFYFIIIDDQYYEKIILR